MNGNTAAVRAQLAAANVKCEYPGCTAQATGVLKIGSTMPYLCDDHLADRSARGVAEHAWRDAEHRSRYPNGLTLAEWLEIKD